MISMLKFYTKFSDSPSLAQIPCAYLIPKKFYAASEAGCEGLPWDNIYTKYWNDSESILQLVPLSDADIVVLPYDWYWYRGPHWLNRIPKSLAEAVKEANMTVYQQALSVGKPVILFFSGDRSHEPTPFAEAITFREGIYLSRSEPQDYCMPAFFEDIALQVPETVSGKRIGCVTMREKNPIPTIGFCGFAPAPQFFDRFSDIVYQLFIFLYQRRFDTSPHYGERLRYRALKALNAGDKISTNFIVREDKSVFLGNDNQQIKARQEFICNMATSDYVLCCRGSGNYSYRVYETLCMGRIPVIIVTDSQFPYAFHVDWRDYCLFVEHTDLQSVSERIYEHYNKFSAHAYYEQQLACRHFWENYLSPQGFFKHLPLHFNNEVSDRTQHKQSIDA
jgi:hypothetical protein